MPPIVSAGYRWSLLLGMIATSTVAMLLLSDLNSYSTDHLYFRETRAYLSLLMGGTMAIIMLLSMLGTQTGCRSGWSGVRWRSRTSPLCVP